MPQTPLISLVRVSKKFDSGQEALSEISAEFHEGTVTYVTGHSGAGKTTLLRLVLAADKASRGKVMAAGRDIGKLTVAELPWYRRNVGVVFQSPNLISRRTIFENVALPLLIDGEKLSQVEKRVRVLYRVCIWLEGRIFSPTSSPLENSNGSDWRGQ